MARAGLPDKLAMQSLALLSGGEQTKVKLAELMMQTSNLLFLDEPTNHIDEAAKKFTRSNSRLPRNGFSGFHEADFYEEIVDRVIDIEELVK